MLLTLAKLDLANKDLLLVVAVAALAYLVVDKSLALKAYIDSVQFKAAKAGGVAAEIGFQKFDDLLQWCGAGNIKKIRECVKDLWQTYCQDARGPVRLARDVFIATWAKLRNDVEYGNECRALVVSEALGVKIDDETDMLVASASERLNAIGWTTLGAAGKLWAARKFKEFTPKFKSLFDEVMEPDGEKKIASRVAAPTMAALWSDPKFRPVAEAIVKEYAAKLADEEAARKQKVLAEADAFRKAQETV